MTPTNEQIIAEANRRRKERGMDGLLLADFIIEVMREGWTPPDPVDPDLLAFREWLATSPYDPGIDGDEADLPPAYRPDGILCQTYLAGARMAAERERERAKVLEAYVKLDEHGPHLWTRERARKVLAKYQGEA